MAQGLLYATGNRWDLGFGTDPGKTRIDHLYQVAFLVGQICRVKVEGDNASD